MPARSPARSCPRGCRSLNSGMRGLKRHQSARLLAAGHAFVQNLRCGHYDIATEIHDRHRLRITFDDLMITV